MFSFRTTSIFEQEDLALRKGRVGVFCTPNCWHPERGEYLYEIFAKRGNLKHLFSPSTPEFSNMESHIYAPLEQLRETDALIVEIQGAGARYFAYTNDLLELFSVMVEEKINVPVFIVDHINPAGRQVEGTMSEAMFKLAHRHGLTIGEVATLVHNDLNAKFPLHIISVSATPSNRELLPWTIPMAADMPGYFTCRLYSGSALWSGTNVTPGIGTTRPYEIFGAPFMESLHDSYKMPPAADGATLRPCRFQPSVGEYAGKQCFGYQIILEPGAEYHALAHTLQLMNFVYRNCEEFSIINDDDSLGFDGRTLIDLLDDEVLYGYVTGEVEWDVVKCHIKEQEQKWIKKARKFLLYEEEQLFRVK